MDYTDAVVELVRRAGDAILEIYSRDIEVETKDDDSPLTQADLASHRVLVEGLEKLTPDIPVMSEEGNSLEFDVRSSWSRYWLIDPLDGTKEFINKNGEFTVNVALIEGHASVFGVVGVHGMWRWPETTTRASKRRCQSSVAAVPHHGT